MASAQQTAKVTASGIGYLEYLPQGYHSNTNKYPVVISLHGIKEKGTTSTIRSRIIADLAKVDNVGLPKYVNNGKKYPFILISPQLKSNYGTWPGSYVMQVVNHVKRHLRIDERRIYLTGLSLGGFGVWRTAGEYPDVFAAIAPVCSGGSALNRADEIAAANLPIWGFHGSSDRIVSYKVTTRMINAVNSAPRKPNPLAKTTIFPGLGHNVWDKTYQETGVLNWLLSHRKGSAPKTPDRGGNTVNKPDEEDNETRGNKKPSVQAGGDRSISLPTNTITLAGKATDADGKIVAYQWRKISGAGARLHTPHRPRLIATRLQKGTYVFRLTVRDDDGGVSSDDVKVIVASRNSKSSKDKDAEKKETGKKETGKKKPVKKKSRNALPFASSGPDRVMQLPSNSITIRGRASDRDGKIVSYEWAKTYGGRLSLAGADSPTLRISNMDRGVYIFRFRVRDNDGGVRDDYFKITVHAADHRSARRTTPNRSNASSRRTSNATPVVSAGANKVLDWPRNSVAIDTRASDKDGRIVSYHWHKTYGGRATINNPRSARAKISNLRPGAYIFRVTVTDDDGARRTDFVKVTVRS